MTHYIGGVLISSIQEVSVSRSINEDEIDIAEQEQNLLAVGEMEVDSMEIGFTLYESSQLEMTLEELKKEIKTLPKKSVTGNIWEHNDVFYFLSVQEVSFSDESDRNNIIEGTISSLAFPSPKNYTQEFSIQEGGYGSGVYGLEEYVGAEREQENYGMGTYGIYEYGGI